MKRILIASLTMLASFSVSVYAQSVEDVFRGLDEFVNRLTVDESALFEQKNSAIAGVSPAASLSEGSAVTDKNLPIRQTGTEAQKKIALLAATHLGKKYQFGAAGPDQFDCSGLIYHVFSAAGYKIPRTSQKQGEAGVLADKDNLQTGDLVFFDTRSTTDLNDIKIDETDTLSLFAGESTGAAVGTGFSPSKVTHSGIYIGDGKFIHASSGSVMKVVVEDLNSKYFAQRFLFAKSYLTGAI